MIVQLCPRQFQYVENEFVYIYWLSFLIDPAKQGAESVQSFVDAPSGIFCLVHDGLYFAKVRGSALKYQLCRTAI